MANSATSGGSGWCEIYRASAAGRRITSLMFQPVPGATIDRLWIMAGDDPIWLPSSLNPLQDSAFLYNHESTLTTGYMYAGLYEIYKFLHSLTGITENLGSNQWIEVDCKVDNESTWSPLAEMFNSSPSVEISFNTDTITRIGLNCTRARLRYRLETADQAVSPILKATVLDNVSRVPVKYSYGVAYRVMDVDKDINGDPDPMDADDKQDLLDLWATQLVPLTMRCNYRRYDNKTVFIDPASMQPFKAKSEAHMESFSVIEI
jgi:hypothetical protein